MSDESTPKFRLRPKLAGGPPAGSPSPVKAQEKPVLPEPSAPAPAVLAPEAKPVVLRPKLALKADEPIKLPEPSRAPPPPPENGPGPYLHDPREFPTPAAKPLQVSPRLKAPAVPPSADAAGSGATPPFPVSANKDKLPAVLNAPPPPGLIAPPPAQETWPAVLNAPPPPGLAPTIFPSTTVEEEPAEVTAIRKASTFPFPSPTAKFPPLPGLAPAGDSAPPESAEQEGFLKKLLLFGTLALLLLVAGGAFAYFKFFAKHAATAVTPPNAIGGKAQAVPAPATENKTPKVVAEPSPAPVHPAAIVAPPAASSAPTADATTASPAPQEPAAVATPAPVVVKAEPPQPSLAFKAWVINLRIRGVRGGEAQRVFIDRTSYVPGDVVNQQLGIIFVGYDESTRLLTFRDKSGATFERRH